MENAHQPVMLLGVGNGLKDHATSEEGRALAAGEALRHANTPPVAHRGRRRAGNRTVLHEPILHHRDQWAASPPPK